MAGIRFHAEAVKNPLTGQVKKYKEWLSTILENEEGSAEEIQYIFCDDAYILEINNTYLGHDYYTDIITFPYSQGKKNITSDIFISLDTVLSNSQQYGEPYQKELHRVMAHGILHLLGYNDKSKEESQIMRAKENECLALWETM